MDKSHQGDLPQQSVLMLLHDAFTELHTSCLFLAISFPLPTYLFWDAHHRFMHQPLLSAQYQLSASACMKQPEISAEISFHFSRHCKIKDEVGNFQQVAPTICQ